MFTFSVCSFKHRRECEWPHSYTSTTHQNIYFPVWNWKRTYVKRIEKSLISRDVYFLNNLSNHLGDIMVKYMEKILLDVTLVRLLFPFFKSHDRALGLWNKEAVLAQ